MRITLERAGSVSGIVVMPDGAPAAGANVWLESSCTCRATDAQGRFEFSQAHPPGGELRAGLDGLVAATEFRLFEGGAASDVRLVLSKREVSFVRIRVLDGKGRGVRDARASWQSAGDDGTVTVKLSEPPGTETDLDVTAPGFLSASIRARTFPSPDVAPVVEVALRAGVHILLDARAPDGTALLARASFTREGETRGRICLEPEAVYDVRIVADGCLPFDIKGWRAPPCDSVLAATMRPCAAVRGRVVDSQGEPVTYSRAVFGDWVRDLSGERDGCFLIEGIGEGRGTLSFVRPGRPVEAALEIETLSGRVTDVGTVTLKPPVALAGRVVDSAKRPLGGAIVWIETAPRDSDRYTFSHADGTFRILIPAFASVSVLVRKHGFGTVLAEAGSGPARTLGDLVLPAPGSVEVEVEGLGRASVELAWPGGPAFRTEQPPGRMEDLAPGRYVARLRLDGGVREQEVLVVAGETTKVTFRLER